MYQNKIVAAIKVNGKVLREDKDTVTLPFGCEYSILVKNLDSVRAQFTVSVDGQDATEGVRLILESNSSIDLERFIKNGNFDAGNRFKFISRSPEIEEHRGISADDGLIRIEAWKELVYKFTPPSLPVAPKWPTYPRSPIWMNHPVGSRVRPGQPQMRGAPTMDCKGAGGSSIGGQSLGLRSFMGAEASANVVGASASLTQSDVGITVAGSESHQKFHASSGFDLEPTSTVIVLRLKGDVNGEPISKPITVDVRPICSSCGRTGKPLSKFCDRCGTALQIL